MKCVLLTALAVLSVTIPVRAENLTAEDKSAEPPVIVELFAKNACVNDDEIQRHVEGIMRTHKNAILVNCRKQHDWDKVNTAYSHRFCTERMREYRGKFEFIIQTNSDIGVFVVVNGKLDANPRDIGPAIRLGENDNVTPLDIEMSEDGILRVVLPEQDKQKFKKQAYVTLYAYAPSRKREDVIVDVDAQLDVNAIQKINADQRVPFVTALAASDYYFRPVVARYGMGHWNGEGKKLEVALDDIPLLKFDQTPRRDLSFVVSVQEGNDFGPVLAAGELMSDVEQWYLLPKSEPVDFNYITPPNPLLP